MWHPRALGPASGSQTQTAHGKAGFAKWPNRVRGRLGPRTGGSHTRPRSQPHLGPVCCHSPMTLCSLGPVCAGRGWRPAEQCPARHPACVCSLPPGAPCPPSASPPRGSPACSLPPALSQAPVTAAPPAPPAAALPAPCPLPLWGLPPSHPSLLPLYFLPRRNLRPPSFITRWTGSRYSSSLRPPGASVRPGAAPAPAPRKVPNVTLGNLCAQTRAGGKRPLPRSTQPTRTRLRLRGRAWVRPLPGPWSPSPWGTRARACCPQHVHSQDPPGCPVRPTLAETRPSMARSHRAQGPPRAQGRGCMGRASPGSGLGSEVRGRGNTDLIPDLCPSSAFC